MAVDEVVDGQNAAAAFRWRWFDAARYVLALAVTALMITVIAHAVHVLLRPDDLFLQVDKGFVAVKRGTPAWNLSFALDLEVINPSGRVAIFYEGVTAYLYGSANEASQPEYFVSMDVGDISLRQQSSEFEYLHTFADLNSPDYKAYFDLFKSSGTMGIPDGVVAVNGTLTVGLYSWRNQTPIVATYYCWPVAIGGDSSDVTAGSARCTDDPPRREASLT
ncbi:uncharacterized protein [Lolium perenne]|jgi:hypothetical protein|uniref:uncharacterized protein n=1 Tax=Lolium perenne TaxID=4522 RepID=UPI0021EA3400|nr:uncharacterized protein LOC127330871 [Lolium perenne]